jgi:hypothetical protein
MPWLKILMRLLINQIARVYLEQSTGVTLEVHQVKINSLL